MTVKDKVIGWVFIVLASNWFIQSLVIPFGAKARADSLKILIFGFVLLAVMSLLDQPGSNRRAIRQFPFLLGFLIYLSLNSAILFGADTYLFRSFAIYALFLSAIAISFMNYFSDRVLFALSVFVVVFVCSYSLLILFTLTPSLEVGGFRLKYAIGGVQNPNNIGNMLLPLLAYLLSRTTKSSSRAIVLINALSVFCLFWILGLCNSHANILGSFLGIGVVLFFSRNKTTVWTSFCGVLGIFLGISVALYLSQDLSGKPFSGGVRLGIWKEYMDTAIARPIFGHGFMTLVTIQAKNYAGELQTFTLAHSIIIHLLVQGGIVGILIATGVVQELCRKSYHIAVKGNLFPIAYLVSVCPPMMFQKGPLLFWTAASHALIIGPIIVILIATKRDLPN